MTSARGRRRPATMVLSLAVTLAAVLAQAPATPAAPGAATPRTRQTQDLIVQSTTSVRDSGVLDQLITPQFERRYPQWNLKFVAVGTGQAIANARAGQGDVLIGHSPALEAQFVRDGFSYERVGRTIMWNDFVIVGPPGDPAGILRAARNDAASAFEAIAAAGARGRANFVSRGDNSGTNAKEREIWTLGRIQHDALGNPTPGGAPPGWYHTAGLGMADTLRLTQQCPFAGGGCYTITDRGTLQQLTNNGAITGLRTVMDDQRASARGGGNLMLNVYNAYAVNPAKFSGVKLQGALAFLDFLTSKPFQNALARFPSRRQPGFFPAAFPRVTLTRRVPRSMRAGTRVTVAGRLAAAIPGAAALAGMPVSLVRFVTPLNPVALARARTDRRGRFRITVRVRRSGPLALSTPRFQNLSPLSAPLGRVRVRTAR